MRQLIGRAIRWFLRAPSVPPVDAKTRAEVNMDLRTLGDAGSRCGGGVCIPLRDFRRRFAPVVAPGAPAKSWPLPLSEDAKRARDDAERLAGRILVGVEGWLEDQLISGDVPGAGDPACPQS